MAGESPRHLQCLLRASHSDSALPSLEHLRRVNQHLQSQNRLQRLLLDSQSEALLLWQQGQILQTNACLDNLIDSSVPDNFSKTQAWKRWISTEALDCLLDAHSNTLNETTITDASGKAYRVQIDHLVLETGPAQLLRINTDPDFLDEFQRLNSDSVTGLLTGSAFISRWRTWVSGLRQSQRYVAMLINLPDVRSESGCSGINHTLQDLLVFRASSAIEQHLANKAIVGRTRHNSLLLLQTADCASPRKSALSIKALLGSLGGLIDDPSSITIQTLTLTPGSLSAADVLMRLERMEG